MRLAEESMEAEMARLVSEALDIREKARLEAMAFEI